MKKGDNVKGENKKGEKNDDQTKQSFLKRDTQKKRPTENNIQEREQT